MGIYLNEGSIRPEITIPMLDRFETEEDISVNLNLAILQGEPTYTNLSSRIGMGLNRTRGLIKELQLCHLNPFKDAYGLFDNETDLGYYYPTVQQIYPGFRGQVLEHSMRFPQTREVKWNQLCRYYQHPVPLHKPTSTVTTDVYNKWRAELNRVMKKVPLDNREVLNFAKKCGIEYQQTELQGGTIQSLVWTTFGFYNEELLFNIVSFRGEIAEVMTCASTYLYKYFQTPYTDPMKREYELRYQGALLYIEDAIELPTDHLKELVMNRLFDWIKDGYNVWSFRVRQLYPSFGEFVERKMNGLE